MSSNFKLPGNVLVSSDSFKRFHNILAVASEFILNILAGILSLVVDLLGLISSIAFTISRKATDSNEKLF